MIAAGDRSLPISWRTFARDIEAIAWQAQKFVPGATVGLLGENSYEWITTHAAGLFAGNVIVPIETNLTPAEIAERLIFTEARVLIHSALYAQKAHEVEKLVPGLIAGGFCSRKADELMEMARTALEKGDGGVFDQPPRSEEDVSTLVFTSGTTSKPHGAELTLRGTGTFVEFAGKTLSLKSGECRRASARAARWTPFARAAVTCSARTRAVCDLGAYCRGHKPFQHPWCATRFHCRPGCALRSISCAKWGRYCLR